MYKTQIVLELLVLYVGMSHSWDIAVTHENLLEFYTNEIKTNTFRFDSFLRALAYDEVHDMMLYVDKQTNNDAICAYSISLNTYECFLQRNGRNIHGIAFDPVTELLFFSDTNERSISWIPLIANDQPGYNGNLVIKLDEGIPTDIAVDSCRGYVYWINTNLPTPKIERVRFDGSEREVILTLNSLYTSSYYKLEPHSLVIDQGTQTMYWMEPRNSSMYYSYYADLDGENKIAKRAFFAYDSEFTNPSSNTITVSETNLYVMPWCYDCERTVFKYGKKYNEEEEQSYKRQVTNEVYSMVAKYHMRIQDIKNCEALTCLERKSSVEPYCVHGEKVFGRCLCKCAPGYIGKRCDVSVCDNYCLQGSCSVDDVGLPKCRCNSGYSGERCGNSDGLYCVHGEKVIGQSVCKCAPGYIGERCDVSVCDNYCLQGYCSVNDEGLPKCRCNSGYSGERCGNSDGLYCVHGEKVIGQSVCKCAPGYIGERCDVSVCDNYCLQGSCSVNDEGLPKCRCYSGYSGERCGNSDGLCCVHGEKVIGQSVCKCAPGYTGERCDVSVCGNYCFHGNCSVNDDGLPKCRCNSGYSGERCEIDSCHGFCLNNGVCSLNEEDNPSCECVGGYQGSRCEASRT